MGAFNKFNADIKKEMQQWLYTSNFTHRFDIEPSPSFTLTKDEFVQKLRQVIFKINKKYLKSSFPKWKAENKFYCIAFKEGNEHLKNIHYHVLVHVPEELHIDEIRQSLILDFNIAWIRTHTINAVDGKKRVTRDVKQRTAYDEKEKVLPLNIQRIKSSKASTFYASKDYDANNLDYEDYCIVGLDDSSNSILTQRRRQLLKVS